MYLVLIPCQVLCITCIISLDAHNNAVTTVLLFSSPYR